MRILISLSGLHRVDRGAEVALEAIADGVGRRGHEVTVLGTGADIPDRHYRYVRRPAVRRERFERWPNVPLLREPSTYESLTFNLSGSLWYRPAEFDVTVTCGTPWDNLALRRPHRGGRPPHVFVTENGDWPACAGGVEGRLFGCEGLVCTNPVYLERNRHRWNCALIPNGVDTERFTIGPPERAHLGLWEDRPVVLMVSALIPSKRVEDGIRMVAELDDVALVVAGDGPLAPAVDRLGRELLGDRFVRRSFPREDMPALYRSTDVLLHLSHAESFGNVYIEALAAGMPVVAHHSPITTWILGDDDPGLVDTDDHTMTVEALMTRLDDETGDPSARRDSVTRRFAWPAVAEQYERFLSEVVSTETREVSATG